MKELTIEEKAKAYDEALKKARQLCAYPTTKPFINDLQDLFPELKESEDERIRKKIIDYFRGSVGLGVAIGGVSVKDMVSWLEKQGEQEVNEPDWCHHKVDLSDCSEEYRKAYYDGWNNCNQQHSQCNAEQKPADKVESKFKVGDWVVSPNGVHWHIDAIQNGRYEVTADTGQCGNWPLDTNIYRLWTIQDAKDGDVLKEDSCTFIINKMNPNETAIVHCCLFDDGEFDLGSTLGFDVDSTHPATKEQRDLLFQKMKEAGYEWDAEKKELKKTHVIDEGKAEMDYCFTKMMKGERVTPAWSKKDEETVTGIINDIQERLEDYPTEQLADIYFKEIKFLKSLKNRVGCEVNCTTTWKPSDEQMRLLKELVEDNNQRHFHTLLRSLYEDLEKLKGE